jgi:hypothetical protein
MSEDLLTKRPGSTGLVERAKAILMTPKTEWPKVAAETTEPMKLFTSYALPLILIGPIAMFIGVQVFGFNAGLFSMKLGFGAALGLAVATLVGGIVSLLVIAFVANLMSPQFGGRNDFSAAFRLVVYAWTASWIGGIFGLFPAIAVLAWLFLLYSLYLLYLGSGPVMGVPQDKTALYTVVTALIALVVNFVVSMVVGAITASMFLASAAFATADSTIDMGELGSVNVAGENSTVDMGELGRIEMNGDTATLTVDGQEVEVNVEELEAQAAALEARAEAARPAE